MEIIDEIAAERRRQIEVEGWTAEHDDGHDLGEMARAAAAYALEGSGRLQAELFESIWPPQWGLNWWKPTDCRRDLIKAAALIVAEIERIDRAA